MDAITVNISDPHLSDFIDRQITSGRFASRDEVVQAALEDMARDEAKREALRDAIIEGEESGIASDFDFDAFIAQKRARTV